MYQLLLYTHPLYSCHSLFYTTMWTAYMVGQFGLFHCCKLTISMQAPFDPDKHLCIWNMQPSFQHTEPQVPHLLPHFYKLLAKLCVGTSLSIMLKLCFIH